MQRVQRLSQRSVSHWSAAYRASSHAWLHAAAAPAESAASIADALPPAESRESNAASVSHQWDTDSPVDPFGLVADELAELGERMRHMVVTEVPRLAMAAEYFFKSGAHGKRFRPTVLLLMASSLGPSPGGVPHVDQRARQQRIAEITEMIHLAVLAGDFLLARASGALASLHNTEVVELLSQVLEHLVAGEIMQMSSEPGQASSMEYYLQKNFYKTASLMANSCKAIAVLGGQSPAVAELAFLYGRHLGLAFQLVDDALDFTGTLLSLGKPSLSDLRQGLATAPVLYAAEEHPGMHRLIDRKFCQSGDVDQALEWVRSSKGLQRTHELAAHHSALAAHAVADLPPPCSQSQVTCRRALVDLTTRVLTRKK
eukprot:jgi/Mesen1/3648/ME000200S02730